MAGEEDAVHVEALALEPFRAGKEAGDRGNRSVLVGLDLDAEPDVPGKGQQLVDHVEAQGPVRMIDTGQVRQLLEAKPVPQETQNLNGLGRRHRQAEIAVIDGGGNARACGRSHLGTQGLEDVGSDGPAHLSIVPVRRIFF